MGLPTTYTQKVGTQICQRLANGESLRAICRDSEMPNRDTVQTWLRGQPKFAAQYVRARELQADFYAEDIIEIADTEDDWQRARVRIDARKWTSSRMAPTKWGDKLSVDSAHSGEISHKINVNFVKS